MKCPYCKGFIGNDEEVVKMYMLPQYQRKRTVHLRCFILKHFIAVVSNDCTPSDAVIVKAYELCGWCRKYGEVVAGMNRTNQAICMGCHKVLSELFEKSIKENSQLLKQGK